MAKTILIIDDNPADRQLAEKLLRVSFEDWHLVGVGDALALQSQIAQRLPDAVICDATLHWARGIDVARELKAAKPLLPIIFFCSPLAAGREEELLSIQPADLLTKSSLNYLQLPKIVASALRKAELFGRPGPTRTSSDFLAGFDLGWFQYQPANSQLLVNRTLSSWIGKPQAQIKLADLPALSLCGMDLEGLRSLTGAERSSSQQVELERGSQRRYLKVSESVEECDDELVVSGLIQDLSPLEEQRQSLERSNEDLQNFASIAGHQLKEPLRMVQRFTDILAETYASQLDAQAGEYLRFASDGAKRMSKLVDDLLSLSRVDSEPQDFRMLEAEDLVTEAITNLHISLDETDGDVPTGVFLRRGRIKQSSTFRAHLPQVYGDKSQLVQVFQNLFENALKFRHPDLPPVIRITAQEVGENWQFEIADNGLGFASDEAETIFESYRRLHSKLPGSGMGLAIARRIIERHGGKIWAVSQPGEGAKFLFTLPGQPGDIG